MKKPKIVTFILFIVLVVATAIIYSEKLREKIAMAEPLTFHYDNIGYISLWKKADSLSRKGLPRSVLEVVNGIYEKAKKEEKGKAATEVMYG